MYNNISYRGKVKITVKNKPTTKLSNSGTSELFTLICNVLANNLTRQTDLSDMVPVKIGMIYSKLGSSQITEENLQSNLNFNEYIGASLLTQNLIIVDRKIHSDTNSVYYSATLLHNNLRYAAQLSATSASKCYVLLLNNSDKILAYAPFYYSAISDIWTDNNGQGVVEWEMYFSNKEVNS